MLFHEVAIGPNGIVYAVFSGAVGMVDCVAGSIHALNPDGTAKWVKGLGGYSMGAPAVGDDGTIYVAGTYLYAYEPTDGDMIWKSPIYDGEKEYYYTSLTPIITPDGTIIVGVNSSHGYYYILRAFSPQGGILWTFEPIEGHGGVLNPIVDAGATVFVPWTISSVAVEPLIRIYWIDSNSGMVEQTFDVPALSAASSPLAMGYSLYFPFVFSDRVIVDGIYQWAYHLKLYAVGSTTPATEPDIVLSSRHHDFGGILVGDYVDWNFVISNVGNADLMVNSVISDNPDFTVVSPNFLQNIPSGGSLDVTTRFSPSAEDSYSGNFFITSNDPDEPVISAFVEGRGVGIPDLTIYEENLEFYQETTNALRVQARINNIGNGAAASVEVEFADNGNPIGTEIVSVPVEGQNVAETSWELPERKTENHRISVRIVSSEPPEQNTTNNEISKVVSAYYVDSGRAGDPFEVTEDGYSFPNWGMNPKDVKESFKSWWKDQDLSDKVLRVLLFANPAMIAGIKGHCYGMATTSILYRDYPDLKPVAKETYDMQKEDPGVVGKIRVYHAMGGITSLLELMAVKRFGGYDASAEYSEAFDSIVNKNRPVLQVLSAMGTSESHAVAGYMILVIGNENRIYVYENEVPGGNDIYVRYDLTQNQVEIYGYDLVLSKYPFVGIESLKEIMTNLWTDFIQSLKENVKNLFLLNSPADLVLIDASNRRSGFVSGDIVNEIPGASTEEFGGAQTVYVPNGLPYRVEIAGCDIGNSTLDIILTGIGRAGVAASVTYESIPTTESMKASIDLSPEKPTFIMAIDLDGDGITDDIRYPDYIDFMADILVTIDIRPGSEPNSINLSSQGVLPVAVLSSPDFDASQLDPDTVTLSGAGVAVKGKGNILTHLADVNGDGLIDLVVQVEIENLNPGELQSGKAWFIGGTYGGDSVAGSDEINIVPPEAAPIKPSEFALLQNYPNSFNPDTWIPYQLAKDVDVTIRIYSVSGNLIRTLALGYKPAGFYTAKDRAAHWDGNNEAGEQAASGIYFYNIHAGDFTATKKMLVAR